MKAFGCWIEEGVIWGWMEDKENEGIHKEKTIFWREEEWGYTEFINIKVF